MAFTSIIISGHKEITKLNVIPTLFKELIQMTGDVDLKRQKKFVKNAISTNEEQEEDDAPSRDDILNKLLSKAKNNTLNDFKSPDEDEEDGDYDDELYEDDDDDDDWSETSEIKDLTVVDKINEISFIKEAFQYSQQANPVYYEEIMRMLDEESKGKLESYIKNEEARNVQK